MKDLEKIKKRAKEASIELGKVLQHNKYLLEKPDELFVVLEVRFLQLMAEAYRKGEREGKESIIVNDLSPLKPEINKGNVWN